MSESMHNLRFALTIITIGLCSAVVLGFIASCEGRAQVRIESTPAVKHLNVEVSKSDKVSGSWLIRIVDREAGVVCYQYYSNGLSCISLSDTKLKEVK